MESHSAPARAKKKKQIHREMQNSLRPQKRELFQLVNRIFDVPVNYDVLMSSRVNIVLLLTFEFARNKFRNI